MDLLLILTYVAFCYAIFKVFRIPVNQWTLGTATLGGIVGIVLLLLTMNYNHPFTSNARIYFAVTFSCLLLSTGTSTGGRAVPHRSGTVPECPG